MAHVAHPPRSQGGDNKGVDTASRDNWHILTFQAATREVVTRGVIPQAALIGTFWGFQSVTRGGDNKGVIAR